MAAPGFLLLIQSSPASPGLPTLPYSCGLAAWPQLPHIISWLTWLGWHWWVKRCIIGFRCAFCIHCILHCAHHPTSSLLSSPSVPLSPCLSSSTRPSVLPAQLYLQPPRICIAILYPATAMCPSTEVNGAWASGGMTCKITPTPVWGVSGAPSGGVCCAWGAWWWEGVA